MWEQTLHIYIQVGRRDQRRLEDSPISEWQKRKMHDPDKDGFVALHYAVQYQNVHVVKRLLEDKCGKIALYESSTLNSLNCLWNI